MSYVAGAITLGTALYGGYKAVKSSNAEKRDRAALAEERKNRPDYFIPEAFEENRDILGNAAGQGFGSAAKDFYTNLTQGGLTASLNAAERSGAGVNSLNELLDSHNQSAERLAAADSQMKAQNIGGFIDANSALAGQQLIKKFGIPNQRSQNDIASLNNSIYQDQAGVNSGISDITGAAASYVASQGYRQPRQQRGGSAGATGYVGDGNGYAPSGIQGRAVDDVTGATDMFDETTQVPINPPASLGNLQPTYIQPQAQIPPFLRKPQPQQYQPATRWEQFNY